MIVVLNSRYPYHGGEPYLGVEMQAAGGCGEKIVLFPQEADAGMKFSGALADIVCEDICLDSPGNRILFLYELVVSCFSPILWKDVAYWKRNKTLTAKGRIAALVYLAKARRNAKVIGNVLKKKYKDEKYVFYSYWMHTQAVTGAFLKKQFPGSRFVTRCHGYDLYEYRASSRYLPFRPLIFENADEIFPVSENGAAYLKENYGFLNADKIKVCYLGTLDHGTNPGKGDEFHIVSCSNLISLKRVHLIIKALGILKDRYEIKWTHYGDGGLRSELEQMAEELLGDRIDHCFKGQVSNRQLMTEYRNTPIDLFINVSETEGLPVSIMEAMSFGIPVIATDVGGTSEIVEDGVNGKLLARDFQISQLASMIEEFILQDTETAESFRASARQTWQEKFDGRKNYLAFYSNLR